MSSNMESVNTIEYNIRDLGTRSVTLFPTVGQVEREIKDIDLKACFFTPCVSLSSDRNQQPGTNEITIVGLSPTVDEDSIKVQGSGSSSAIITGIATESHPNRELFDDVYPQSDDGKSDAESESDRDNDDDEWPPQERDPDIRDAQSRLRGLQDAMEQADETVASAVHRLRILDHHAATLYDPKPEVEVDIENGLAKYKQERGKTFQDHTEGIRRQRDLTEQITDVKRELAKLKKQQQKQWAKENKAKEHARKEKEKKQSKKMQRVRERTKEKARVRNEHLKFWPRLCYSVCITIECNANTPTSSRRTSIASEAEVFKTTESDAPLSDARRCDLVLSYVTSEAGWSPSYDLQLFTTTATGALCFDAQLRNTTSETWSNCKVTLSTPQAALGSTHATPTLQPWKIRLAAKDHGIKESHIIRSAEEANFMNTLKFRKPAGHTQKPRSEMFWGDEGPQTKAKLAAAPQNIQKPAWQSRSVFSNANTFGNSSSQPAPTRTGAAFGQAGGDTGGFGSAKSSGGGLFGSSNSNTGGFGSTDTGLFGQPNSNTGGFGASAFGSANAQPDTQFGSAAPVDTSNDHDDDKGADGATLAPFADDDQGLLDFEESVFEETGFTTTYDLPGLKTLAPRSNPSKQRVARLKFTNVVFSHTVVAKYSPVANLKAKFKNTSKMTLLRGQSGLTLDGSFIGHTTLPRCSAGDMFSLPLGVDPAIRVAYMKPDVRRVTTGIFSKEDSSAYVRTISLKNTRALAGKPVSILVLDQIPVSEDERLRVELLNPRGVSPDGPGVAAGAPGRDAKQDQDWGSATASLKKSGEVNWQVSLNAGKAVRLSLEYTVALPSGVAAVQC